jgi:hypothetical protein
MRDSAPLGRSRQDPSGPGDATSPDLHGNDEVRGDPTSPQAEQDAWCRNVDSMTRPRWRACRPMPVSAGFRPSSTAAQQPRSLAWRLDGPHPPFPQDIGTLCGLAKGAAQQLGRAPVHSRADWRARRVALSPASLVSLSWTSGPGHPRPLSRDRDVVRTWQSARCWAPSRLRMPVCKCNANTAPRSAWASAQEGTRLALRRA